MTSFISRHIAFDHCRALLPWFAFARSSTPMDRLRRRALEMAWDPGFPAPSPLIAAPLYFASSLRQIYRRWREASALVQETYGRSRTIQLLDLCWLAWRHNHSPHDYYNQRLWQLEDRGRWRDYLSHREHVVLISTFERVLPVKEFDDKLRLYQHLNAAKIATIPILAVVRDGQSSPDFTPIEALHIERDLVLKPAADFISNDMFVCRYVPDRRLHACRFRERVQDGRPVMKTLMLDRTAFLAHVDQLSRGRDILIQPRQFNHPVWDDLAPGELANFRIVTGSLDGQIAVQSAILRLGFEAEDYPAECYIASVDVKTGTLGHATGRHLTWGTNTHHIQTHAPVLGRRIERWADLMNLAIRAHHCFPWMPLIGWDVIDTLDGPMIMEGNAAWGADISQIGEVLGETNYAECTWQVLDRVDRSGRARD